MIDTTELFDTLMEMVQTIEQKMQLFTIPSSTEHFMQEQPVFSYSAEEMVANYMGTEQGRIMSLTLC